MKIKDLTNSETGPRASPNRGRASREGGDAKDARAEGGRAQGEGATRQTAAGRFKIFFYYKNSNFIRENISNLKKKDL